MRRPQAKDVPRLDLLHAINEGPRWMGHPILKGFPVKVLVAAFYKLADADLADYGVSVNCGWLTEAGKAALSDLTRARASGNTP